MRHIMAKWKMIPARNKFVIGEEELQRVEDECRDNFIRKAVAIKTDGSARLLAEVVIWTLSQVSISCNMISENFSVGWRRANSIIKQMKEYGIVGDLDAKLPRKVIAASVDEIPQKTMEVLLDNGFSVEDVCAAIRNRDK